MMEDSPKLKHFWHAQSVDWHFFSTICHFMRCVYTLCCHTSLKNPFEWKLYLNEDCIWLEEAAFDWQLHLTENCIWLKIAFDWKLRLTEHYIWPKIAFYKPFLLHHTSVCMQVWHIATKIVLECPVYSLLNGLLFAIPISRPWPKKVTLAICLCLPKPKKVLLIITLAHFACILLCTSGQVTNRKPAVP